MIAASTQGQADAEKTYRHLENNYENSLHDSAEYYANYLQRTVQLDLPDYSTAAGLRLEQYAES